MRDLQNPSWFPASSGNHEGFCKSLTEDIYHDQTRIAEYEVKTFQAQLDFGIQPVLPDVADVAPDEGVDAFSKRRGKLDQTVADSLASRRQDRPRATGFRQSRQIPPARPG